MSVERLGHGNLAIGERRIWATEGDAIIWLT